MTTRLGSKIFRDLYHLRIVNEESPSLTSSINPTTDDPNDLYNHFLGLPQLCLKNDTLQRLEKTEMMSPTKTSNSEIIDNIIKIPTKTEFDEKLCSKKIDTVNNKEIVKDSTKKPQKQVVSKTNNVNKRFEPFQSGAKPITRTDLCITNYKQMRPSMPAANKHFSKINNILNERYVKETCFSKKPKKISLLQDSINFNRSVHFVVPRVYGQWKDPKNLNEYQAKLFVRDATAQIVKDKKRAKTLMPPYVARSLPVNFLPDNIKSRAPRKTREQQFKILQMFKISPPSPSFSERLSF